MKEKFLLSCCNLALELKDKNSKELTKIEKSFLNAFDKYTDEVLENHSVNNVNNITLCINGKSENINAYNIAE